MTQNDDATEEPENVEETPLETAEEAPEAEEPAADPVAELTEDLQRVTAEYANYRRRSTRERQAAVEAARASVVSQLLPIMDDLALAKQHGDLEEGPLKAFSEKFHSTLDSLGLVAFGEEGEGFDPELHEAVQDSSSGDEKILGTVLRQGYRLGDKTIRHAMVMIADPAE
ncbi:nucleotide exchange factor GrpE [Corynebacterium lowii]|uniref:Protein GrpE n=1 Tax=Corynebacterium lowii TaxID=1544413 RepID=A0A0Q0YHJ8_9CORY|nr:nucleotide exchange factor GrpE [Corynebacterium lowii]KQB86105.1 Protein GrpE [Corynebacterium lowii]MDP9852578.1 molecular chaperone GrpE [Corynebacterium lowii]